MQRTARVHLNGQTYATPLVAIGVALGLLLLVALSIVLQPPRPEGSDGVHRTLAWARAILFSGGALAFLVALLAVLRGVPLTWTPRVSRAPAASVRRRRDGFTLVASGGALDDARAIADAGDAGDAVQLLDQGRAAHPEEQIVIFAADGEPLAYRRPAARLAQGT
jgi:hypothetical protein